MKEKFNIALKNQYKEKDIKADVVAIVGNIIILMIDSQIITASIKKVNKTVKEPVRATGENQDLVNYLNYVANGSSDWDLTNENDEYILVDGILYRLEHMSTVFVSGVKENHIPSDTTIGDDISLCI